MILVILILIIACYYCSVFYLIAYRDLKLTDFRQGYNFITYTAEPFLLLPWLIKEFVALGGKMERRNIKMLQQLAEEGYDLIINCSGLGARELVADKTMTPIRGQVYRVIFQFHLPLFK